MSHPHLILGPMPLGNPDDVTIRFLREAGEAQCILCESRRVAQTLLKRHGIERPDQDFAVLDEQTTPADLDRLIQECERLRNPAGGAAKILLVSDAGLPVFCDPGADLLKRAEERGWSIEVLPGGSALDVALVRSGLNGPFYFAGFPPREKEERRRFFQALGHRKEAVVFYETPYRAPKLLEELRGIFPATEKVFVGIDLTAKHEQILRFRLGDRVKPIPKGAPVFILTQETRR